MLASAQTRSRPSMSYISALCARSARISSTKSSRAAIIGYILSEFLIPWYCHWLPSFWRCAYAEFVTRSNTFHGAGSVSVSDSLSTLAISQRITGRKCNFSPFFVFNEFGNVQFSSKKKLNVSGSMMKPQRVKSHFNQLTFTIFVLTDFILISFVWITTENEFIVKCTKLTNSLSHFMQNFELKMFFFPKNSWSLFMLFYDFQFLFLMTRFISLFFLNFIWFYLFFFEFFLVLFIYFFGLFLLNDESSWVSVEIIFFSVLWF